MSYPKTIKKSTDGKATIEKAAEALAELFVQQIDSSIENKGRRTKKHHKKND